MGAKRKTNSKNSRKYREQRQNTVKVLLFCLLCICVLVGLAAVTAKKREKDRDAALETSDHGKNENMVVTNGQEYQAVDDIRLDTATGLAQLHVVNAADSGVYLKVTVELKTGGLLYESELLEPGGVLEEIRIEDEIAAGEYPVAISIDSYALDSRRMLNGVVYARMLYAQ